MYVDTYMHTHTHTRIRSRQVGDGKGIRTNPDGGRSLAAQRQPERLCQVSTRTRDAPRATRVCACRFCLAVVVNTPVYVMEIL